MRRSFLALVTIALMLLIYERNFVFHSIDDKQSVQKEFLIASAPTRVPLEQYVSYYVVRNSASAAEKNLKLIKAPDLVEQNRTA